MLFRSNNKKGLSKNHRVGNESLWTNTLQANITLKPYVVPQDAKQAQLVFAPKFLILSWYQTMGHACVMCALSLSLSLSLPRPYIRTFPFPFPSTKPSSLSLSLSQTHIKNHQTVSKMTKVGKLTKLKSAIKRWPSFTKQLSRASSAIASSTTNESKQELHAVYVGKTRRRYLVSSEIIDHPLFQELVDKSGEYDDGVVVACEVVLFEHLLWMLDNAENQLGSMDELVEFYTTC